MKAIIVAEVPCQQIIDKIIEHVGDEVNYVLEEAGTCCSQITSTTSIHEVRPSDVITEDD